MYNYVKDVFLRKCKYKVAAFCSFYRSIPLEGVQNHIKLQPRNEFRIFELRKTKRDSPLDHVSQWNPVSTEDSSVLPVSVDGGDPGGRNDHSRESRRRLLFASDPT